MTSRKELEDFQLDMVDKFLVAAHADIDEMRRVIKNLQLFDVNTPARLTSRTLLAEELSSLQNDLSYILSGLVKANTRDTVMLVGDEQVKAESEALLSDIREGVLPVKKSSTN